MGFCRVAVPLFVLLFCVPSAAQEDVLPGTEPLRMNGDPAREMVDGINRWLANYTLKVRDRRRQRWRNEFVADRDARRRFVQQQRRRLQHILGLRDRRVQQLTVTVVSEPGDPVALATGPAGRVFQVRWPAFGGVHGEGLWLEPAGPSRANVILLPDADWLPEAAAGLAEPDSGKARFAEMLLRHGCRVVIPVLINRSDRFSGHPAIRYTNQPHREFVYRGAYELGRHIIGYELQKVLALVDYFTGHSEYGKLPVGVAGYGEGGMLALYATAIDERIDAALVSGYVAARETLWQQPIYRNVWSLVRDFGDGETLALIAPRPVVVEASRHPQVPGPPPERDGRRGAAPGRITTPSAEEVRSEVAFGRSLLDGAGLDPDAIRLVEPVPPVPGSADALNAFLRALGITPSKAIAGRLGWKLDRPLPEPTQRQYRQLRELIEATHWAWWQSQKQRERFWRRADRSSPQAWQKSVTWYRDYLHREILGRLPRPAEAYRVRTRKWREEPRWVGYEVRIAVYEPDVFAYGILLVPRAIDGRRPVVVCQHGLEGRPEHTINRKGPGFGPYQAFAARLADMGYVVYAPQNPYIGRDRFRSINRRANPLGLSMFSFIIEQHRRTVEWLRTLPFVDPERIGFYGLSYGGKTAMRVPAVLADEYALSICSADFNEWIWKNTSYTDRYSYVFTIEYEMFEFDLGNTFNYAELAALIAPRPFMVERGHRDGVAPDEWVAYEYARVRRLYVQLGLADRTAIEFFDGPHQIHGVGTFAFLQRHLPLRQRGPGNGVQRKREALKGSGR